jgi:hypothetical protein
VGVVWRESRLTREGGGGGGGATRGEELLEGGVTACFKQRRPHDMIGGGRRLNQRQVGTELANFLQVTGCLQAVAAGDIMAESKWWYLMKTVYTYVMWVVSCLDRTTLKRQHQHVRGTGQCNPVTHRPCVYAVLAGWWF